MMNARRQARKLDRDDPLRAFRDEFWLPRDPTAGAQLYFCGNSLGLQPRRLDDVLGQELEAWRELGVAGHFQGERPWVPYHEALREPLATLAGARPAEVVAMNSLTVNLHLAMASFYRPRGARTRIVIERQPFPSDRFAVESQIRWHGLDPRDCLVELGDPGERLIDESRVEDYLAHHGEQVALVLWPGVHYASGQRFDLARISRAARAAGAHVGFDLAHSIGNVPLSLHDDGADFAAWCSYKYLNAGPGAVAGLFVHERHHGRDDLPRLHGWWGNDPDTRFAMGPEFRPAPGVAAWQISNPPILSMAPLRLSLELFAQAGMERLRQKSVALTGYFEKSIQEHLEELIEIITPADPGRRGCQLSLRVRSGRDAGHDLFRYLQVEGVVADWREPDVIRVAPVPLYNSYEDCWSLVERISAWREARDA